MKTFNRNTTKKFKKNNDFKQLLTKKHKTKSLSKAGFENVRSFHHLLQPNKKIRQKRQSNGLKTSKNKCQKLSSIEKAKQRIEQHHVNKVQEIKNECGDNEKKAFEKKV